MKTQYLFLICLIIFLLPALSPMPSTVHAQSKEWTITLRSGQSISGVSLSEIRSDTVIVQNSELKSSICVDSIVRIEGDQTGAQMLRGTLGGLGIGAALGLLVGDYVDHNNKNNPYYGRPEYSHLTLPLTFGVAAFGGVIGYAIQTGNDGTEYGLDTITHAERIALLQSLVWMREQPAVKSDLLKQRDTTAAIVPSLPDSERSILNDLEVRISVGAGIPVGGFADASTQSNESGGAKTGYMISGDLLYRITDKHCAMVTLGYASNGLDSKVLGVDPGLHPDVGSWQSIWYLAGLQYYTILNDDATFEGFAQIGGMSGKSPDISITVNGVALRESSSSAAAFAFRLGAGFEFQRRLIVRTNFLNATPEYSITATAGGTSISGSSSQPTQMFVFSLGLRLW